MTSAGEARHEVTQPLAAASEGDSHAAAELLPLIYSELQRLARSFMAKEHGGGAARLSSPRRWCMRPICGLSGRPT